MKSKLLFIILLVGASFSSYASTSDLFQLDEASINAEFAEINNFESFVVSNDFLSYADMQQSGALSQFALNFDNFDATAAPMFGFEDMDWGSFLWGFCCFPCGALIGIFTVLLNDDKGSDSKLSYAIGAGVGLVVSSLSGAGYQSSL